MNDQQLQKSGSDDVPLRFARALLVQARHNGLDIEAVLRSAQFPFDPLSDDSSQWRPISARQYSRLCVALFAQLQDESGGILSGVRTPPGATRLFLYSIIHCATLQEAMERAIAFNRACRERNGKVRRHEIVRSPDGKLATLHYLSATVGEDLKQAAVLPPQDAVLCSMAMWLRVCGWLIGKDIELLAAGCAGPAPTRRGGLQHFFPCPLSFNEATNWISFAASHLDSPLLRSEEDLENYLRVAPYYTVVNPAQGEATLGARIRRQLGSDLRGELPSFEELAQQLNMSARTLRRRLLDEGTSYQRIKDTLRRDAAIAYLNNPQLSIGDVAELVGFSDPSAFHRSFKRWTGLSPGDFR